jgi:DNA-binding CsgD family transcriptional regulator
VKPGEWDIPDDGIIDDIAVRIAASGQRRVRLTRAERRLAAALIIARGGTSYRVAKHLGISSWAARTLVDSITANPPELGEVA